MFEQEEIETYLTNLFKVGKTDKTIFNYVPVDNEADNKFSKDCETDDNVKFYFKLPRGFNVPTPIGNYTPDWAVVFENSSKMYFVAETKGTLNKQHLGDTERMKIECCSKHFALFNANNVVYRMAVTSKDLDFNLKV
jgi:type III restriction enzyme